MARLTLPFPRLVHISVWCHVMFQTSCLHEWSKHVSMSGGMCVYRGSTEPLLGRGILSHLDQQIILGNILCLPAKLGLEACHSIPTPSSRLPYDSPIQKCIQSWHCWCGRCLQGHRKWFTGDDQLCCQLSPELLSETAWGEAAAVHALESCFSFLGGNSNLLLLIPPNTLLSFHMCSTSLLTWICHLMNHP